jgi:S-adenosylmethionine synthetase
LKQVEPLTSCDRLKISQKSFKVALPCMNQELSRAVYRKQMLYSQFTKCQSNKNWEKFRKQRNFVAKLKRKSMKTYVI